MRPFRFAASHSSFLLPSWNSTSNALSSIVVIFSGNEICVKESHQPKAVPFIVLKDSGKSSDSSAVHLKNAEWVIDFNELENSISSRLVQLWNAACPIVLTEFGILIVDNEQQSLNVPHGISFKDSEIVTVSKESHPSNTCSPRLFTELGISTDSKDKQR